MPTQYEKQLEEQVEKLNDSLVQMDKRMRDVFLKHICVVEWTIKKATYREIATDNDMADLLCRIADKDFLRLIPKCMHQMVEEIGRPLYTNPPEKINEPFHSSFKEKAQGKGYTIIKACVKFINLEDI